MSRRLALLLCAATASACTSGSIGEGPSAMGLPGAGPGTDPNPSPTGPTGPSGNPDGGPPTPPPVAFDCQPSASQPAAPIDPLSAREYRNTLADLLTATLGDAAAARAVMAAVPLDTLPDDPGRPRGTFQRMKTEITQAHVSAWYQIATAVGQELTKPARIGTVMGACATDANAGNDAQCLSDFVTRFGKLAFRRPLSAAEASAHAAYDAGGTGVDPPGVADVIAGILLAPRFVYHVEHGLDPVPAKDTVFTVDAFELASRLSYQFWETMPDAALTAAAASGALSSASGFAAALDRIYADPRTAEVMHDFYREWMNLDQTPDFENDSLFRIFVGSSYATLITPALRQSMIDEAVDLFDFYTWQTGGGLDDSVSTDLAFPRTPELAAIYGLPAWDGGSAPPSFAPGTRPGILTRAAFLVAGGPASRPIMRGVLVRRNLLCDAIPDPPADAAAMGQMAAEALTGNHTTREITESITQQDGSACQACHATLINPIGFAFERFDAIGRLRTEEPIYKPTGAKDPMTGEDVYAEVARLPVDSTTIPGVFSGDRRPSAGASDLARYIVDSGKTAACFARNYFRFTYRRTEDDAIDGCALEQLRRAAERNGSLKLALRAIAEAPEFRERSFK